MHSVADWNFMRNGITQATESLLWALMCKWAWHFWCLSQENVQFKRGCPVKLGIEIFHGAHFLRLRSLVFQTPFCTNLHSLPGNRGQSSHCLFISASVWAFVYVSTSNPALSGFCPPAGSVSAVWLWSHATIYSTVSTDSPAVHIMLGNQ